MKADEGELLPRFLYLEPLDGLGPASKEADEGGLLASVKQMKLDS